jgi:hypothetical protein
VVCSQLLHPVRLLHLRAQVLITVRWGYCRLSAVG